MDFHHFESPVFDPLQTLTGGFALISILTTRFDQDRPRAIDDAQELERVFKA